jgi:hypothetical protein
MAYLYKYFVGKKALGLLFKQGFNKELFNPIAGVNKQV